MFSVFFLIDCCISVFFYFLIKTSVNLKKLIIVSNVIFAFLEHLKPKIFFVGQPRFPT